MRVRDESDCKSTLNRRNVLLSSSALIVASALGSSTITDVAHAQAAGTQSKITEQEAHAIGVDAYLYFYSLISADITRLVSTNIEPGKEPMKGPRTRF